MVTLKHTIGGNLAIVLDDKKALKDLLKNNNAKGEYKGIVGDILEASGYLGNNWYEADNFALTDAPVITYGAIYESEESENPDDFENVWAFLDYQVSDFVKLLFKNKQVIFKKV